MTTTSQSFSIPPLPTRLVFGPGSRSQVGDLLADAGIARPLVLSTSRGRAAAQEVAEAGAVPVVGYFDQARMHVPTTTVAAAVDLARELGADGCVAFGGGSTIGLAKALALQSGLPYVAVPTTYAGSEMTSIWGLTDADGKRTGRDERVRPVTVVYDPDLSTDLPVDTSVVSGLNALAHAAEALYAPDRSPYTDLLAEDATASMVSALRRILADPHDTDARGAALYAAAVCGLCLGATAMSIHHKICHVLGGTFDLPHAETHATVLPHVLAFNLPAADGARERLTRACGGQSPADVLWTLCTQTITAGALADLGLKEVDLDRAAALVADALGDPQANPRPASHQDILGILRNAWSGERPTSATPRESAK